MMSTTLSPNQTSSFIDTSTDLDNLTYKNYSGNGGELQDKRAPSLEWWEAFEAYRHTYWSIVVFITVTGIIGNILLFIMMGYKKLNSFSYSVYLRFLAVFDSLVLIVSLINETQKFLFLQRLAVVQLPVCVVSFSVRVLVAILSPWLVVGLTLDRYVCVCFPLTRERLCTRMKAFVICFSMLGISIMLTLPFPASTVFIKGQCFPSEKIIYYYYLVILLCVSSILPCMCILVLNIPIIIQIQRSHIFRNTFIKSSTDSTSRQKDVSTRPLVLVSVLAFFTLIPVAISRAVNVLLKALHADMKAQELNVNIKSILSLVYLLNFGQNFYILFASSKIYRETIKKRLALCRLYLNRQNQQDETNAKGTSPSQSAAGSGTTGLSMVSIKSSDQIQ